MIALLAAAALAGQVVVIDCPNGDRCAVDDPAKCACVQPCAGGAWVFKGERCPSAVAAPAPASEPATSSPLPLVLVGAAIAGGLLWMRRARPQAPRPAGRVPEFVYQPATSREAPAHVIEFERKRPPGMGRRAAKYVKVAGVQAQPAALYVEHFIAGAEQRVELVREPDNPHDRNAIRVLGVWRDPSGATQRHPIGYVPRDVAPALASEPTIAGTVAAVFRPTADTGPGVRIDVWVPRRSSKASTEES